MQHSSKEAIEESRLRNEKLYESLLRLEALLADVQSGKTYNYIWQLLRENAFNAKTIKALVDSLTIKKNPLHSSK